MAYVREYLIKITNDAGTVLEFGNYGTKLRSIKSATIKRENIIGIGEVILDNKNDYDQDFQTLNLIEIFLIENSLEIKRFSGTVEESQPSADNTKVTLTCHDNNAILSRRSIVGTWRDIDLGLLVKVILQEKCPEIDVSLIDVNTGIILDLVQSASLYIADFFDDVFKESNYNLFIDDDLIAQFYITRGSSGLKVVDAKSDSSSAECLLIEGSSNLKNSNISNINSVTVLGGNEQIPNFIENFTFAGSKNFSLKYRVADVAPDYVTVNSVPISQSTDYDLSQNRTLLSITSTLVLGDLIEISYTGENPIWTREQDPTIGLDKIREQIVADDTILTLSRAQNLASTLLEKFETKITKGSIDVVNVLKPFSKGQTIELDITSFKDFFKIEGYTEIIGDTYKVGFSLNQILDMNTKKIYELLKNLQKLQNINQTIDTIRDGFNLSDDVIDSDLLEGFETDRGTRWTVGISLIGGIDTIGIGEGTETQFL